MALHGISTDAQRGSSPTVTDEAEQAPWCHRRLSPSFLSRRPWIIAIRGDSWPLHPNGAVLGALSGVDAFGPSACPTGPPVLRAGRRRMDPDLIRPRPRLEPEPGPPCCVPGLTESQTYGLTNWHAARGHKRIERGGGLLADHCSAASRSSASSSSTASPTPPPEQPVHRSAQRAGRATSAAAPPKGPPGHRTATRTCPAGEVEVPAVQVSPKSTEDQHLASHRTRLATRMA